MRICVYGAGAVGGLIAAWLARSGQDVSVVARGAQLQAIQHHGLRVRSKGEVESFRIKAEADPAKLGTQDYVLVTVKAQNLTHVAESISPLLDKDTSVVTAMNGVPWWFFDRLKFGNGRERLESLDPGGKLSRAMPTGRIVGCVIHLAASTPEPGLISHNMGKRLILGEPGGANTARTRRIAEALAAAGFEAVTSEFIEKEFWVKLLGNVSFNPVSALTMTTADRLIEDQEIKAYMVQIIREVLAIGRAVGGQLGGSAPEDLARCAKLGADEGYDEINLNVGCPSERVQKGAFGACLIAEPTLVAQCVSRIRREVGIPVTVKHRTGVDRI